nr:MAG TPA_asm: hypothetical protein [Caudoviricetes sp.]
MECIGLILQIILLGFFLIWEGYNKKKGENRAMKEDSREVNYEGEKGKNLATKQDIADITRRIESVKDSYNKALEAHKIELQKEFESHKYIMELCRSLDNILLKYISACLKADSMTSIDYHVNNIKLLMENSKLASFLNTYKYRYDSCHVLMNLRTLSDSIDFKFHDMEYRTIQDVDGSYCHEIPNDEKEQLLKLLNESLMYFLPPIEKTPEA